MSRPLDSSAMHLADEEEIRLFKYRSVAVLGLVLTWVAPSFANRPTTAGQNPDGPPPTQLHVVEQFIATGGEPTFWTASSVSDLVRTETAGRVEFGLELTQIESVIGNNPPVLMVIDEGAKKLVIGQSPSNQSVSIPGDLPVVQFLNGLVLRLGGGVERTDSWSEVVPVFSEVIPGFTETRVRADFTVEKVDVRYEGGNFELYDFRTDEVGFDVGPSRLDLSFRGYVLIDADRKLAYLGTFEQRGLVRSNNGAVELRSELVHSTTFWLQDDLDQLLVPYDSHSLLAERQTQYQMSTRPEAARLNPEVFEPRPRPEWGTGVWIAGRLANAALGMVAEQATNPLPALALGTILLTDESLSLAGNAVVDNRRIDRGEIEASEFDVYDGDYPSPIQFAYSKPGQSPTGMVSRLGLLKPAELKAAVAVGRKGDPDYRVFGIGLGTTAAALGLLAGSSSKLGFAAGGGAPVSVGSIATGAASSTVATAGIVAGSAAVAGGGIGATTLVVGGAVVAGGVVVAVDDSDSGSTGDGESPGPADIPEPCPGDQQESRNVSANEATSLSFDLGEVSGTVSVEFDPFGGAPDRIELFQGGSPVASSDGQGVNGFVSTPITLSFEFNGAGGPVTATVTAGADQPTSLWVVTVNCPVTGQ